MLIIAKTKRTFLPAFSLVELILAIGLFSVIATATLGMIHNSSQDFLRSSRRSHLLQEGHAALAKMVRTLRQASEFTSVSESTDTEGSVIFMDNTGIARQFQLDSASGELRYGQVGQLSMLTDSVSDFTVVCYDVNGGTLAPPVSIDKIKSMAMTATLADSKDASIRYRLTGRMVWPRDSVKQQIVINELMYNPPGIRSENYDEWLELYNATRVDVDLSGFGIWTGDSTNQDRLVAHMSNRTGTLTIPAGGYAVVTVLSSGLYDERIIDGGFDSGRGSKSLKRHWDASRGWFVENGDAHTGSYAVANDRNGNSTLSYRLRIPARAASCTFVFCERTTAPVAQTTLTVTIRDRRDRLLETIFSGSMSSYWKQHSADLLGYAGQRIHLHFSAVNNAGTGTVYLDSVSLTTSDIDPRAVRLAVDDSSFQAIGGGLDNSTDTVALVDDSGQIVDRVTYSDSWGGDGNGRSLQRIDPYGDSSDGANWQAGPRGGTPGTVN